LTAWRLELACIRAGFPPGEVRKWSAPKLNLWAGLIEEHDMNLALLQSAAVWDAKGLQARFRGTANPTHDESPKSAEELLKLMEAHHA
jgi:hypothetical protein